jgi:cobalt-precorrin-7 (C5)-methyltransferase
MGKVTARIKIVGCGPGSAEYLTPVAVAAGQEADVLVGARRLLDLFPLSDAERVEVTGKISAALNEIDARFDGRSIAVLVSGDPGIFSLSKLVIQKFGRERCEVIPGISSVQVAFARLGIDWSDARIISAHKSDPDVESDSLLTCDKLAVLGGRAGSLKWIASLFANEADRDRRIYVFEDLTTEEERMREVERQDLESLDVSPRTVVLLIKRDLLS